MSLIWEYIFLGESLPSPSFYKKFNRWSQILFQKNIQRFIHFWFSVLHLVYPGARNRVDCSYLIAVDRREKKKLREEKTKLVFQLATQSHLYFKAVFLHLSTIDFRAGQIFVVGSCPCCTGCLAAALASTCLVPVALFPLSVTIEMSPDVAESL